MKRFFRSRTTVLSATLACLTLMAACSSSSSLYEAPKEADPSMAAWFAGTPFLISDFEREYAKSVGGEQQAVLDSMPQYAEFLSRYVDYRLKVLYARELGLEEAPGVAQEMVAYRQQLARPYLMERTVLDPILQDLYVKKQSMVDASHILKRLPASAPPEDTLAAYQLLASLRDSIAAGADFGDLAFRHSDDPSAKGQRLGARGRLGYFAGGQMVKAFEDWAYRTPVGQVSPIFRSQFGMHILFVHDRRDRVPDRWASHIVTRDIQLSVDDTSKPYDRAAAILAELQAGADFSELAREKSEERNTGDNNGVIGRLNWMNNAMPAPFKTALFDDLKEVGDYSGIVETTFGFHIIRLDQIEQIESFEESYEELKNIAVRLPRVKKAEEQLADSVMAARGVRVDTTAIINALENRSFTSNDILSLSPDTMALEYVHLGDTGFPLLEIIEFAEGASITRVADTLKYNNDVIKAFLRDAAINFAASDLENQDPEFRSILGEFEDGLLLFRLMEDSVWTAAAQDTAGLMAYHAPRKADYRFPNRTRIISLLAAGDSTLSAATDAMEAGTPLASLIESWAQDSTQMVRVDTTYQAAGNNSIYDQALELEVNDFTEPLRYQGAYMVMINDGIDHAREKTFKEARSEVLTEYQTVLEEQLLERLRTRYAAIAYPENLASAFQGMDDLSDEDASPSSDTPPEE